MSEFKAHEAFAEAAERHEHAEHTERHGAKWVPIAAAILAVVTAIFSLLNAQRTTESLVEKNNGILATSHANDAYNEYEARSIKQHIYEALVSAGNARDPKALERIAEHERAAGRPALERARRSERDAAEANERAARLLVQIETLEVGITFLDIAIVLVSISALVTTRVLTGVAIAGAAGGFLTCVFALLR